MNLEKSSLFANLSKKMALVAFVTSVIVVVFAAYTQYAYQKQGVEEEKEEPAVKQVIQKNLKAIEDKDANAFLETVAPETKKDVISNPTYKAIFNEKNYSYNYSSIEIKLAPESKLPLTIRESIKEIKDKNKFEDIAVVILSGGRKTTFYENGVQKTTESEVAPLTYVIKQNGKWYVY
jgi:hypothetical protein